MKYKLDQTISFAGQIVGEVDKPLTFQRALVLILCAQPVDERMQPKQMTLSDREIRMAIEKAMMTATEGEIELTATQSAYVANTASSVLTPAAALGFEAYVNSGVT